MEGRTAYSSLSLACTRDAYTVWVRSLKKVRAYWMRLMTCSASSSVSQRMRIDTILQSSRHVGVHSGTARCCDDSSRCLLVYVIIYT